MSIQLLTAKVAHTRHFPKKNSFLYRVFYIQVPVTKEPPTEVPLFFSWNHFNIFSLYTEDHGSRETSGNWYQWIEQQFKQADISLLESDRINLICHPRLLGYAFNPISYWLLHSKNGELRAVLCEVNNTFGDTHNYILSHKDGHAIATNDIFHAEKKLYVSPFTKMSGRYEFLFTSTKEKFQSTILYYENEVFTLTTSMGGTLEALSSKNILASLLAYPLMTILVVLRIHWQAIKLYCKKVKHTLKMRPRNYTSGQTTKGDTSKS
ncbi:MAG: DUF1365 domain-containing protein [Candidatus Moranbacteria bacterium]|nr:DUF1365 domain-containing protein [Candidatus Moranbacteria bacterium]